MNKISSMLAYTIAILLIIQQSHSHFFNFDHFLHPVLNPLTDATVRFHYASPNNLRQAQAASPTAAGKGKKGNLKPINRSNQDFYGRKKNEKYVLQSEDFVAKDLYQAMGISEQIIYNQILPIHMEARHNLNCYFYKGSNSKKKLHETLVKLNRVIQLVFDNCLQNIQSLIIGNDNTVIGSHIFLKADNQTVIGNNDIIFNTGFPEDILQGSHVVRISRFDVCLSKIDLVLKDPYLAVKLLDE